MNTLFNQPDDILKIIFGFLNGLDLIRASQVNHKCKTLIDQIMYKPVHPSIEQCIMESNYYHFKKYLGTQLDDNQKKLIKLLHDEILIRHFKIDIEVDIDILLMKYSKLGNLKVVKLLLEKGADQHVGNDRAFRWSAKNGHIDVVKVLLEKGADVHANNDGALLCSANNDGALLCSAANGHLKIVKLLLERGANIYANNNKALRWSARRGHIKVVKLLLEKGANIHAKNDYAIYWSASNGHLEIVKLLLEKGADLHANDDEALCMSAINGHLDIVKLLLEKGANLGANTDFLLKNSSGAVLEYLNLLNTVIN